MFDNKVLMITGGTGSFGHTVLRRFLDTNVREIRIFSRDEKKQEDMRIALANDKVKFYIGDVRDYDSLAQAMTGVDYVFHAAALKQVPSCEFYPMEAVRTNVLGTENMLNAAIFGTRFKRYGTKLSMFVVREQDQTHRHHIHCVIERPQHISAPDFIMLTQQCWTSTRYGYQKSHFELPTTEQRELGWIDYCLKARTKTEYSSCIDWSNSTCFELR